MHRANHAAQWQKWSRSSSLLRIKSELAPPAAETERQKLLPECRRRIQSANDRPHSWQRFLGSAWLFAPDPDPLPRAGGPALQRTGWLTLNWTRDFHLVSGMRVSPIGRLSRFSPIVSTIRAPQARTQSIPKEAIFPSGRGTNPGAFRVFSLMEEACRRGPPGEEVCRPWHRQPRESRLKQR